MKLFIFLLLFSSVCFSQIVVEPRVGLHNSYILKADKSSESGNGLGYGVVTGYKFKSFYLGLDYLESGLSMADLKFNKNFKTQEYALLGGLQLLNTFRLYAGYIFDGGGRTSFESRKLKLKQASGYKVGVAYDGHPLASVFLEYRSGEYRVGTYNKIKLEESYQFDGVLFGFSIPIGFKAAR